MEEVLNYIEMKKKKGATLSEIKKIFGDDVEIKLNSLQKNGKIYQIKRNYFISLKKTPFLIGKAFLKGRSLFVETEKEDYYFSSNPLKVMEGDIILLKKEKGGVRILKIVERAQKNLIGFYLQDKNFVPLKKLKEDFFLNKPIPYPYGSLIETEIILYPDNKKKGVVSFKNYLGKYGNTEEEISSFCLSKNLPFKFPEEVLIEAEKIKENIKLKRLDLTDKEIFTIDPKDAKDFDDAISLEEKNGYFILGVHIADVSHYIKEGSLIDREAEKRGETLYFPSFAVHMLPPKFSENLCSLKERKKRLTVSVFIFFDSKFRQIKTEIKESLIFSRKRFTYEEVEEILNGKKSKYHNKLKKMEELADHLKEKRMERGSLEFEFPEFELEMDLRGNLKGIFPIFKLKSHFIIEEFMLLANREVARFLFNKNYPILFRIHPKPDPLKLLDLKILCSRYGIDFPVNVDEPTPGMIQKVLEKFKNYKDGAYLQQLLLRSLPRALYSPKRELHFALNFENYCHFTSPIRRYADLVVHRSLKNALKKNKYERKDLKNLSEHLNLKSKEKEEIERDFLEYKILQLLKGKEGEITNGIIESVIESGFFVFLTEYFISGFLPFSSFKEDYFIPNKTEQKAKDLKGKYDFKIRDEILVKINEVNPFKRFLSLSFFKKI